MICSMPLPALMASIISCNLRAHSLHDHLKRRLNGQQDWPDRARTKSSRSLLHREDCKIAWLGQKSWVSKASQKAIPQEHQRHIREMTPIQICQLGLENPPALPTSQWASTGGYNSRAAHHTRNGT